MLLLLHALHPNDTFLDVGAHVGVYSLLACSVPGVNVVAFEPSSDASCRLMENIQINDLQDRCTIIKAAVGDALGAGYLTRHRGTMNVLLTEPSTEQRDELEPVEVVSLDSTIAPASWQDVAVVKIDVEGHELAVLAGATNLLRTAKPVVLVEANDPPALAAFFDELGFAERCYDPIRRVLIPPTATANRANRIYVGDIPSVQQRIDQHAENQGQ